MKENYILAKGKENPKTKTQTKNPHPVQETTEE